MCCSGPCSKINLGLGAYGRSWTLASPGQTAVGSPAYSAGQPGQCTRKQAAAVSCWHGLGWLGGKPPAMRRACSEGGRGSSMHWSHVQPVGLGHLIVLVRATFLTRPRPLVSNCPCPRAEQGGYIAWYEIKDKIAKGAKVGGSVPQEVGMSSAMGSAAIMPTSACAKPKQPARWPKAVLLTFAWPSMSTKNRW